MVSRGHNRAIVAAGLPWVVVAALTGVLAPVAHAIENTATADLDGTPLDLSAATVTLTRVAGVADTLVAEVSPGVAPVDAQTVLVLDLLATIAATNTGFDVLRIDPPAGYTELSIDGVQVDDGVRAPNCPTPGAGEFCALPDATGIELRFGSTFDAASTQVSIALGARTPATTGSDNFAIVVTHTPTSASATAVAGDADGDAGDANSLAVDVTASIVDGSRSEVTVDPPVVIADGIAAGTITVRLRNGDGLPLAGRQVELAGSRGSLDAIVPASGITDSGGILTAFITSTSPGLTTIVATDSASGFVLPMQPVVTFTQGLVLELDKVVDRETAAVGDVLNYTVFIRNRGERPVEAVRLLDAAAPVLRLRAGSVRLDDVAIGDPAGDPLVFDIGTVPGLIDSNGNGIADAGETGYLVLRYQMIVGAGARPGDYDNRVGAIDVCESCRIAEESAASFAITLDPLTDLGTIIGKVFDDRNGNGRQDGGETGVADAMVVLDDGTYALTDPHGRYNFPLVVPGQRLLKINTTRMDRFVETTTDRASIVQVTPGLMVKVNFGIRQTGETRRIGRAGEPGLLVAADTAEPPVLVTGSARMPAIAVNGRRLDLPFADVRLRTVELGDQLSIEDGALSEPAVFRFAPATATVRSWTLAVSDWQGRPVFVRAGTGAPPDELAWDGGDRDGQLVGGGVYRYQLETNYADGSRSAGEERLFGVNRTSTVRLELAGGAFVSGSHELTPAARELLRAASRRMRASPDEQIIIAGHTDSVGSEVGNLGLSERRARAALEYLVGTEGLDDERFLVHGYGESRPRASNETEAGRERNRRVEIRGELAEIERAVIARRHARRPAVSLGGRPLEVGADGRFAASIDDPSVDALDVEITTADARTVATRVAIPTLRIAAPLGHTRVPATDTIRVELAGSTEPGNQVTLAGQPLPVAADGSFSGNLELAPGDSVVGLTAVSPAGITRIVNLRTLVTDHDGNGRVMVVEPVPELVVQLPPADTRLGHPRLVVPGLTRPGNLVVVNDEPVPVDAEGYFAAAVQLVEGPNAIVAEVTDPEGYVGRLEHNVEYRGDTLFLLAFADARLASIRTHGNLEAAGADAASEVRVDGRVAFYLKGRILGRYLLTSAYDSGVGEAGGLFADFDTENSRRLLANIDPDRHYPVYGDSSTVVYDTQRTGKFYLAVESDVLDVRIGSYALNLADTELSAYRRTLDGARLRWQSDDGEAPRTEAQIFTATVRQQSVHDVLATTGGSLYYLSQDAVIEGSEQVALVVRDQHTGVVLRRVAQVRNTDYTIDYDAGRLVFRRPLSSVDDDAAIIDQGLLAGNPVSLEVDYETRGRDGRQSVVGGRVQRRLGETLTVGGTYVEDRQMSSQYQLAGVDAEAWLGEHVRLVAELAESSGNDSLGFVSADGGLSYTAVASEPDSTGHALKLATEIDLGALGGREAGEMTVGGYFKRLDSGFRSAGNGVESDSEKMGLLFAWKLNDRSTVLARHDRQRELAGERAAAETTVQWQRRSDRLQLTMELQDRSMAGPAEDASRTAVAGQARMNWTGKLATTVEYQQGLRGEKERQTTLGLDYQLGEAVSLLGRTSIGTRGHASEVGARITVAGQQVYATRRALTGADGVSQDATVLGAEMPYGENGRLYSEYQWATFGEQARRQRLVGMRRRWQLGDGIDLLLAGEHTQLENAPDATGRYTLALGLSYDRGGAFRARTLNEWRRDRGAQARTQFLTDTFAEFDLNDSFALQAKFRRSHTGASLASAGTRFREESVGLAYRPVTNDRLNMLARYTLLNEDPLDFHGGEMAASRSEVLSADWSWEIGRRLEWVGKQALRIKVASVEGLEDFTTRTHLSIQRMNVDLFADFGVGMEYRRLAQDETDSTRSGWLTEVMWDHFDHLRLGLGFNFTDFSDNEFSDHDYSESGWFLRLQGRY